MIEDDPLRQVKPHTAGNRLLVGKSAFPASLSVTRREVTQGTPLILLGTQSASLQQPI
jgi:hypothetical protein